MPYTIYKFQNTHINPTVSISDDDPAWAAAKSNWLKMKPPTDSKEWKVGVIALTKIKSPASA
jgi:hypothetical protein